MKGHKGQILCITLHLTPLVLSVDVQLCGYFRRDASEAAVEWISV